MLWPIGATDPRVATGACRLADLRFLMQGMAATARTELLDLELFRLLLLVPGRHIVAPLTAVARQADYFSDCRHDSSFYVPSRPRFLRATVRSKPTAGIEPATSSLPRKCSTD